MPCGLAIIDKKNNISFNFFHETYLEPLLISKPQKIEFSHFNDRGSKQI
jgi:hypothetical protein